MNGEQLKLFIENSLKLRKAVERTARKTNPQLAAAMARIRGIVESIPDESLIRRQQWKELKPLIRYVLEPYNSAMAEALIASVQELHSPQHKYAIAMLAEAGVNVADAVDEGIAVSSSQIQATTKYKLNELFVVTAATQESKWMQSIIRLVDRKVIEGITFNRPTSEIAETIVNIRTGKQGQVIATLGGPTAARQARSYAETVIRNVVESMSEQELDAALQGLDMNNTGMAWEYVALLDSNTCATCAWWDGEIERDKSKLPKLPMHDNCQCSIVPIDFDDIDPVRTSLQLDPKGLGQRKKPPPLNPEDGRDTRKGDIPRSKQGPYTKTRHVGAEKAGNLPTYADYLAETNEYDRAMFFGGGNAGQVRAKRFMELVESGYTRKRALKLLINGDSRNKRFDAVNSL